ncbi:MAG: TlyA family RNA methyltransferase [Myxococcales bacterium]|nr:TlyA family RNA methyltransferase [Myxococcales bacterium]
MPWVVKKIRADLLLVSRGLVPSRERARALIMAGRVFTGDRRIDKPGESLPEETELSLRGDLHPYVSRGGVKLAGALDAFAHDPRGEVFADFGASTGGFTDCLLQRGAERGYAIDVGYGQLHERLRADPRVINMERTNARHLTESSLSEPVDLVVVDASFIGLEKLLPAVYAVLRDGGRVVALVKPQFQVGKGALGKGGVVRDQEKRVQAIDDVAAAAQALGLREIQRTDSSITGPKGNLEAFLYLQKGEKST